MLTVDVMNKLWPRGDQHVPGLIEGIVAAAPVVFPKYGFTPIAQLHLMAQSSEECGAGLEMVENDDFTAEQLERLFQSHFTGTMAERYAHNQRMICDIAYGGRMGNAPPPSDDGFNYRGRGLTNCTGKDGYKGVAEKTGIDVLTHPEYFSDPRYALELGTADFVLCGCLPYALKDDIVGVPAMLNDGHLVQPAKINGFESRQQWTARWRPYLPILAAPAGAEPAPAVREAVPAPPAAEARPAPEPAPVAPSSDLMTLLGKIEALLRNGAKP